MPVICQQCIGTRKFRRTVGRAWWEKLLMRPSTVEVYCAKCDGTGYIKGTPEEETEFERKRELSRQLNQTKVRESAKRQPAVWCCSFCLSKSEDVQTLVSNPSTIEPRTYICNRCAEWHVGLDSPTGPGHDNAKCSFCARTSLPVSRLFVSGPNIWPKIYICVDCVNRALAVIKQQKEGKASPPTAKRSETPTRPSKAIHTLIEVCSRNDLLDDSLLNQAIKELKAEGTVGAQAVAALVHDLLAGRSAQIGNALWAASKLSPTAELVRAVQDVISAKPLISQTTSSRFTPEIVGGGRIGWTDGTASRVREVARDALKAFGVAPENDPDELMKQKAFQSVQVSSQDEIKLKELITNTALGKEHTITTQEHAAKMGSKCIPMITKLVEADLNGRIAWAAVDALRQMNTPLALPIIAQALKSSYPGTKNCAIWYLRKYPSEEGKAIARRHLPFEKDPEDRKWLEDLINNL